MAEFNAGPSDRNRNDRVKYITQRPIEFNQDDAVYKMDKKKRTAIIFNHETFKESSSYKFEKRLGTEQDVNRLKEVLGELYFNVTVYNDLTRNQIYQKIETLKETDFSDEDCLAIFVLSHGSHGQIAASDELYYAQELWNSFSGDKCETLAGKPKLIFINACRGDRVDYGSEFVDEDHIHITDTTVLPNDTFYKIPCMADILVAYSTVEGFVSKRNRKKGSWFIQDLCDNLADVNIRSMELKQILTRTSRKVASRIYQDQSTQVPTIVSTLIRDLYFLPPV